MDKTLLVTLCWICCLWIQDPTDAIPHHMFCNLLTWCNTVHSRPFSCVGVYIVVLCIYRRIIVTTLMYRGEVPHSSMAMSARVPRVILIGHIYLPLSLCSYLSIVWNRMYSDCSLQNFQNWFLPACNIHAEEELNDKKQKQSDISATKSGGAG